MSIIPVEMWADPDTGVVVDGDTQIVFHADDGRVIGVTVERFGVFGYIECNPPIPFAVGDTVTFDPESREVKVVPAQTENRKPLTVGGLIAELGKFPQDMLVVQDGTGYEHEPQLVFSPMIQRAWIGVVDVSLGESEWDVEKWWDWHSEVQGDRGTLTEVVWL